jgi:hypothetical protein
MMHYQNTIITISSLKGEVYREYNHCREGNESNSIIYIPWDSEYRLNFKMPDFKRRRLELYIDGTLVTKDLIVSNGTFLERFIDSDKRFKFVSLNHPSVTDPTASDISLIKAILYKEKERIQVPLVEKSILRGMTFDCCSASAKGEAGATVEGSISSQTFGTTTWEDSEESPSIFKFHLRGKTLEDNTRIAIKCPYCNTYNKQENSSCHNCGAIFKK